MYVEISFDEHALYEDRLLFLKEMRDILTRTDYMLCITSPISYDDSEFVNISLYKRTPMLKSNLYMKISDPILTETFYKFKPNTDEPTYPQLLVYIKSIEEKLNKMLKQIDVVCNFSIMHYQKNPIDFYKRNLHDEESIIVSRTLAQIRCELTERLKVSEFKLMKRRFEITSPDLITFLENRRFVPICADINDKDCMSYFVGPDAKNCACIIKDENTYWLEYETSDQVQTLLIEDDLASENVIEIMFADNGTIFEAYERTDGLYAEPDAVLLDVYPKC